MFERYTEAARRVIFFARYEASAIGSPCIDTEHLLLGVLREHDPVLQRVLKRAALTLTAVRQEIEGRIRPPQAPVTTLVDIPLTAAATRVLDHALDEAERAGSEDIGMAHLFLGLLREGDTTAGVILLGHGLRVEEVREEVRLDHPREPGLPAPGAPSGDGLQGVIGLLRRLEERRVPHHVSLFHGAALRVEIALAEERWAATFFADGRTAVEVFVLTRGVPSDDSLDRLLERLPPPPD